jgi:hypothetical protein
MHGAVGAEGVMERSGQREGAGHCEASAQCTYVCRVEGGLKRVGGKQKAAIIMYVRRRLGVRRRYSDFRTCQRCGCQLRFPSPSGVISACDDAV